MKRKKKKRKLSLFPLKPEEALRAALQTPPPKPIKKKKISK